MIAGAATASLLLGSDLSGITLAAAGALLPDVDMPNSIAGRTLTLGRLRGFLGVGMVAGGFFVGMHELVSIGLIFLIASILPHRGVTHSALVVFILWLYAPLPFVFGYASHLILDAFSGSIPIFWPLKKRVGVRIPGGDIIVNAISVTLLISHHF